MCPVRPGAALRVATARQHGLSLVGLVVTVVVVGFLAVVALRVTPTFVEYRAINAAIKKAKASANTIPEIQKAFDRSAAIDDITVMTGKDLDIQKVDDDLVVSYAYTKKIPLFGPVSLTIDYSGNSKTL
jgi:Tfp pilus assembly protein PilE